jgi:hypothetical protein
LLLSSSFLPPFFTLSVGLEWFKAIVRSVNALPRGVRWISKQVFDEVTGFFPNETPDNIKFMIGKFLLDAYFRPIFIAPKEYNVIR